MSFTSRQESFLSLLRQQGEVEVERLAKDWNIATQTVRRDLGVLCHAGLALRTHGGAKRISGASVMAYEDRRMVHLNAKQAIAGATAKLIPNGASVALNIGTTTELVAEALRQHRGLTVVSNNVNMVPIFRGSGLKSLHLIGGEVRMSDGAIIGSEAARAISHYKVDFAIIGASALDEEGAVLDFDHHEVEVARAILAHARCKILVADGSKFGVPAPYKICDMDQLDHIVLESAPPQAFAQRLSAASTALHITQEQTYV